MRELRLNLDAAGSIERAKLLVSADAQRRPAARARARICA
jgi:hypothetical protein